MGLRSWVSKLFRSDDGNINISDFGCYDSQMVYLQIAIETAVNLIANALSRAEFQTFEKAKRVKKENYYLFNVAPNANQDKYKFLHKLIRTMIYENEALVVMLDRQLYVADGFQRKEYAIKENIYTDVRIDNLRLERKFYESEVFHFQLFSENICALVNSLYSNYGKLIEYSKNTYKRSNARRGTLEIPTSYPQTPEARTHLEKLMNEQMKNFFAAEKGAVLPLTNGIKYDDLTNQTYKNGSDSRDIRSLIDDVFDFVAMAFQIPPQLLKGNVSDDATTQNLLMFKCLKPFAGLIETEINRKMYDKSSFLDRTYLHIETNLLKVSDLKDLSNALDVLMRIGANTLDDTLEALGREPIGGEKGEMRLLTLNYITMDQVLKGGAASAEKED